MRLEWDPFVCGTSATSTQNRIQITYKKDKGAPMAVSVLLALDQPVSLPDLMHFLSYLPEGFDPTEDLRTHPNADGTTHFLEIPLPIPLSGNSDSRR